MSLDALPRQSNTMCLTELNANKYVEGVNWENVRPSKIEENEEK